MYKENNHNAPVGVINAKQKIFIQPEYVIVNLLKADKKNYLSVSRIFYFVSYLYHQLIKRTEISESNDIIYNISFDSIERTVRHNDKVFELIGETIVLKDRDYLPVTPPDVEKFLPEIAKRFAEQYAA